MNRRPFLTSLVVTVAAICSGFAQTAGPAAAVEGWKPLQFLFGSWDAKTQGGAADAQASGSYSFAPQLKGHVLVRQSGTASCKAPDAFDCEHSDVLYIYPDGDSYKAIYFDNEGHVLHYNVSTPEVDSVVFLTDASTPGPQFRLSYNLKAGIMSGKFQGKMPGQADFRSYLEWSGRKK